MPEARDKPPLVSLSEHPRAGRSIRVTKAWGGLLAFGVTGFASHATGMGLDGTALRALVGGIIGYLLTWWLAIVVWRNLLQAEARVAIERAVARRKELAARAAAAAQEASEQ
jgi:hypothetical protein